MLMNKKINLIYGSNNLFRLYLGKTLNIYHILLTLKAPVYVSSGCISALNGSKNHYLKKWNALFLFLQQISDKTYRFIIQK